MIRVIQRVGLAAAILFIPHGLWGQLTPAEKVPWVGDMPATLPPLATDLSPALTRKNVSHAMQKVADWQLARAEPGFSQDWTFGALYRLHGCTQGGKWREISKGHAADGTEVQLATGTASAKC